MIRGLTGFTRGFVLFCIAGVAIQVLARNLPYLGLPLPESSTAFLAWLQQYGSAVWISQFVLIPLVLMLAVPIALLLLVRPRSGFRFGDGEGLRIRPWLLGLTWFVLVLNNHSLDLNPYVAALGALALVATTAFEKRREGPWLRRWPPDPRVAAAAILLVGMLLSTNPIDAVALLGFGVVLVPLFLWLRAPDRVLVGLYLLVGLQLLIPMAASRAEAHDGVKIGEGEVYGFCESVPHRKIYAVVQQCTLGDECPDGHLMEHDRDDLSKKRRLDFFDEQFMGRLQQCVPFDDVVQVGMSATIVGDRSYRENVLEFEIEAPERFEKRLFQGMAGYRLAWDRERDAVYYVNEWAPVIYRLDRTTGELDKGLGARLIRELSDRRRHYALSQSSVHEGRSELVFGAMAGAALEILDLETREFQESIPIPDGMFLFPMVDDERDRIWVAGQWGLSVIDLETRRVLTRRRLGSFNRLPTLDRVNGLVFISSTFDGKIRIFDRDSLEFLGSIAVGLGTRVPMVSEGTSRLFVPAVGAYFVFDTKQIAAYLKGS